MASREMSVFLTSIGPTSTVMTSLLYDIWFGDFLKSTVCVMTLLTSSIRHSLWRRSNPSFCSGYNLEAGSFSTTGEKTLLFHRLIEAWKFAIARRAPLGDIQFQNDETIEVSVM